jgi:hypothetical protein
VVRRLAPRSEACPLSLRDLLAAAGDGGQLLPIVRAGPPGVARAALVAAKELRSVLGLALPPGAAPERWFDAVAQAADEIAPGLPIFLSGEVVLAGGSQEDVEAAYRQAWRLLEGGMTHLCFDLEAVPGKGRAQALIRAAEAALEREICVDCVLPRQGELASAPRAAALFEELAALGARPDLASARFPLAVGKEAERAQRRALAELCASVDGTPLLRRGPATAAVLAGLRDFSLGACEDGGLALAAAARAVGLAAEPQAPVAPSREARPLPPEMGDRPEALAYVEAAAFLEALGTPGSAPSLAEALLARLEDR